MIVVTGATGNVGRPLTHALAEAGEQVTAVSRHAVTMPDGVRHVTADLAEPTSLTPALNGAKALFLLLSGDLHTPEARPADIIGLAAASGVRRVVLLSSQGVATRPLGPSRVAMRAVEDALRESGLAWAVLRPGGFASNALAWAESVRTQGTVAAPFGDVGVPVIDPADIAEVAAACLLDAAGPASEPRGGAVLPLQPIACQPYPRPSHRRQPGTGSRPIRNGARGRAHRSRAGWTGPGALNWPPSCWVFSCRRSSRRPVSGTSTIRSARRWGSPMKDRSPTGTPRPWRISATTPWTSASAASTPCSASWKTPRAITPQSPMFWPLSCAPTQPDHRRGTPGYRPTCGPQRRFSPIGTTPETRASSSICAAPI